MGEERGVNMQPFMENVCMHPHCMNPECEKCSFFTPKAFGVKVSKKLGLVLFGLEEWLDRLCRRNKIG